MKIKRLTLTSPGFPALLKHIHTPPPQLYVAGNSECLLTRPRLAVVGSRKASPYGKQVTMQLVKQATRAGIVIVSGLAIGVDGISHRAALEAGGLTIAVLPCGLDRIYPSSHARLAQQIIAQGGLLVSEYPPGTPAYPSNFIARNRLVSGLCQAVLIVEAARKSGTLHTARFALEQGREVLAIPGNITSPSAEGTNNLIKAGATPITNDSDLLAVFGLRANTTQPDTRSSDPREQCVLGLLAAGISDGSELIGRSGLDVRVFNQTLTMLEIAGRVKALGANQWALS